MRLFYVIILPIIWAIAAITSYFHPGDEYALFVISTIAGSWVCYFMHNIGHLRDVLWIIMVTGVGSLALVGFLMDKLRVSGRVWGTLFGVCFVAVLLLSRLQYPTLDRAIAKNGSITAYVAAACNNGLYLSILMAFIIKGTATAMKKNRSDEPST